MEFVDDVTTVYYFVSFCGYYRSIRFMYHNEQILINNFGVV